MNVEMVASFSAVLGTMLVAHNVADHWVQTGWEAANKGRRDRTGRIACLTHVLSYTATTWLFTTVVWIMFDLSISIWGIVAGQSISAVSHYWADRRFTLERLATWRGHGDFYRLGQPRDLTVLVDSENSETVSVYKRLVVDENGEREPAGFDNPSLGTGAYALDQAWHWFWLFISTLVMVII